MHQVWPFVGQYLEKLLVETIAPSIRAQNAHLQTLSFTKVDMGDKVRTFIAQVECDTTVKIHTNYVFNVLKIVSFVRCRP